MMGEFGGCFMGVSGAVSLGALLIVAAWTPGVSATARSIIFTAWGPHRVTREWLVGRSRDSHRKGACRAVSAILVTHYSTYFSFFLGSLCLFHMVFFTETGSLHTDGQIAPIAVTKRGLKGLTWEGIASCSVATY